jgi:hypothetical protein
VIPEDKHFPQITELSSRSGCLCEGSRISTLVMTFTGLLVTPISHPDTQTIDAARAQILERIISPRRLSKHYTASISEEQH